MAWTRAALVIAVVGALAALLVSGGSDADPRTPPALPGLPPPFLGTAVVGSGGLTAAIDSYGDVVDLRGPGPAGRALISNPASRQAAGTVPSDTGIVPRVTVGGRPALPLWRANSVRQRYLPRSNVLRVTARIADARVEITYAAGDGSLACLTQASGPRHRSVRVDLQRNVLPGGEAIRCNDAVARRTVGDAAAADRGWIARARPLGDGAPAWARRMYLRSLLALRALTDRRSGGAAAGARDGWAYVWPRDAGAVAIALSSAGYPEEARRIARFLSGLDLTAAARFHGDGTPVEGRGPQGDAAGWVAAAARAAGLMRHAAQHTTLRGIRADEDRTWKDRPDYQEGAPGDYLANAVASGALYSIDGPKPADIERFSAHRPGDGWIRELFGTSRGVERQARDPGSGLDSAAAWAVRPFPQPTLFPLVRRSLLRLTADGGHFGIVPSENWPGRNPWTAPTAWSAWSLAALGERPAALRLVADLRRAATPLGMLPERVDARTGIPRSTTPLAWSHAFAILALRQLWP